tara:strand:+ start:3976 stop:4509 length:534 start_codon:yes stop_codon:yes gene_type:complete
MDDGTPINQLQPPELQEKMNPNDFSQNVMSYSDVLKDLQNTKEVKPDSNVQNMQQVRTSQPIVQNQQPLDNYSQTISANSLVMNKPLPKNSQNEDNSKTNENDFELFENTVQNDIIILLICYVILNSDITQKSLKNKFPSLYTIDSLPTTFGVIVNALMLIGCLYISKLVYMKHIKK